MSKGQALLFSFFLLFLISALSMSLTSRLLGSAKSRMLKKNGLIAFYLAQAGLEQAKAWIKNNPSSSLPYTAAWIADLSGGRYYFNVTQDGAVITISSAGQSQDASGNIMAEKQLRVQVQGVGSSPYQTGWSWKEN